MCYGPPGTGLLFENERIRVWEVLLEPGESLAMHRHELPYVVITIEAATCVLTLPDGRETTVALHPGDWEYKPPEIHALRNIGPTRFRNRFVELKAYVSLPEGLAAQSASSGKST
ncbi:MAG: cupin [Oscillochloris sp.]|nr:cupin [Oscillochloris sp.]